MKSVKRTAERVEELVVIVQPSASRTKIPSALVPAVNCWATSFVRLRTEITKVSSVLVRFFSWLTSSS